MLVNIKFVGRTRELSGTGELQLHIPGAAKVTLRDVISALRERGVRVDAEEPGVLVLVNGRNASFIKGLDTEVDDKSEVVIAYFSGGG